VLVTNILASPERAITFGRPARREFIRLLYLHILGRPASEAELDFQVQFGGPEHELAHTFLRSEEFSNFTRTSLVPFLLFAALLQRDITPQERAAIQGKTPEEIITMLVNSPEFSQFLQ
jgi:hypothetical protein